MPCRTFYLGKTVGNRTELKLNRGGSFPEAKQLREFIGNRALKSRHRTLCRMPGKCQQNKACALGSRVRATDHASSSVSLSAALCVAARQAAQPSAGPWPRVHPAHAGCRAKHLQSTQRGLEHTARCSSSAKANGHVTWVGSKSKTPLQPKETPNLTSSAGCRAGGWVLHRRSCLTSFCWVSQNSIFITGSSWQRSTEPEANLLLPALPLPPSAQFLLGSSYNTRYNSVGHEGISKHLQLFFSPSFENRF